MACNENNCLFNAFASVWMDMYQVLIRSKVDVDAENTEIRLSLVQDDLHVCTNKLAARYKLPPAFLFLALLSSFSLIIHFIPHKT
jgi:hypothetical protein